MGKVFTPATTGARGDYKVKLSLIRDESTHKTLTTITLTGVGVSV